MHMTVIRMWLNLRPQKITKKYTHIHRNCESGLAIIYKHDAHRLVQHTLQVVEMAWTDDSTQVIFFYMCYRSLHCTAVWSPVTNTGIVSQATKTNGTDRLPCSYVYRSSY